MTFQLGTGNHLLVIDYQAGLVPTAAVYKNLPSSFFNAINEKNLSVVGVDGNV